MLPYGATVLPYDCVALLRYLVTVLPYCAVTGEGECPASDKHFRQQLIATLRSRALELHDVQFDHSVAPQRNRHVQVVIHVLAYQGETAKNVQ